MIRLLGSKINDKIVYSFILIIFLSFSNSNVVDSINLERSEVSYPRRMLSLRNHSLPLETEIKDTPDLSAPHLTSLPLEIPSECITTFIDSVTTTSQFLNIGLIYTHGEVSLAALESHYQGQGHTVDSIYSTLTSGLVNNYAILMVGEGGSAWDNAEITTIDQFISNGGVFIGIGDSSPADGTSAVASNHGITFTGSRRREVT